MIFFKFLGVIALGTSAGVAAFCIATALGASVDAGYVFDVVASAVVSRVGATAVLSSELY